MNTQRKCKRCGVEQTKDQFAPHGHVCRTCKLAAIEGVAARRREQKKAWAAMNRERLREYRKQHIRDSAKVGRPRKVAIGGTQEEYKAARLKYNRDRKRKKRREEKEQNLNFKQRSMR